MKKKPSRRKKRPDNDTMRSEYDFGAGIRGATTARYGEGANVVVVDPDVLDVFPDAKSVNDVLRALATVIRHHRRSA